MKLANVKYIGVDTLLLKSSSLLMQFSPDQNVGLIIISFFGHVLQGTLLNFRLSSVYILYLCVYIYIYVLDWAFMTVSNVCTGRNSSIMSMGSLDQVLSFACFSCLWITAVHSLTSLCILLLYSWLFSVFVSWFSSVLSLLTHYSSQNGSTGMRNSSHHKQHPGWMVI